MSGSHAPGEDNGHNDGVPDVTEPLSTQNMHTTDCRACGLASGRIQIVNPDGPAHALLAVGEGPGVGEDLLGIGFVGQAGYTLANTIEGLSGLDRDGWARTNLVRCRPPGNRKPTKTEIVQCQTWLTRTIDTLAPRVLLAVGESAGRHLCGSTLSRAAYLPQVEALIRAYEAQPLPRCLPSFRGIPLIPMPHTSGLAWNRQYNTASGERRKIADLGRSCIKVAFRVLHDTRT